MRLSRAAEWKGQQIGRQNQSFFKLIFCAQRILNYWAEYKKIQLTIVVF